MSFQLNTKAPHEEVGCGAKSGNCPTQVRPYSAPLVEIGALSTGGSIWWRGTVEVGSLCTGGSVEWPPPTVETGGRKTGGSMWCRVTVSAGAFNRSWGALLACCDLEEELTLLIWSWLSELAKGPEINMDLLLSVVSIGRELVRRPLALTEGQAPCAVLRWAPKVRSGSQESSAVLYKGLGLLIWRCPILQMSLYLC